MDGAAEFPAGLPAATYSHAGAGHQGDGSSATDAGAKAASAAERVVEHVRSLLERGDLGPGERLPGERQLARETGVSRSSVRIGLRALSAMGVIQSRHGSGTFISSGPPTLESEPLQFMAALHHVDGPPMIEARTLLEVGVAGLAAEHASTDALVSLAEEVANLFASVDDPPAFLVHDRRFHRALGAASGNPILASLVDMVAGLFFDLRKAQVHRASDLRTAAEMHRRIYLAVRARDAAAARRAMEEHLGHSGRRLVEEAPAPARATGRDVPSHTP